MSEYLEKRKKTNKFWLWWSLIEGIVVLAAGILAIVAGVRNETNGSIDNILAYAISGFVVLDGICRVVMYFVRFEKGIEATPLIIAGFEVAVGALLIYLQVTHEGILITSLVAFISIALMVMGTLLLVNSIFQIARLHEKLVMPIAVIVLAAILIGVGIAIMILSSSADHHTTITMIMPGSTLAIIGASIFVLGIFASKKDMEEIEKLEAEEEGDYDLAGSKGKKRKKTKKLPEEPVDIQKADVIMDAEVVEEPQGKLPPYEEPTQISGPRAINHKNDEE